MIKKTSRAVISILICAMLCGCQSQDIATSQLERNPAAAVGITADTSSKDNTVSAADVEYGSELPDGIWVDEHGYLLSIMDGMPFQCCKGYPTEMPVLLSDGSMRIDGITAVPADSEKGKAYISALHKAAEGEWVYCHDDIVFSFRDGAMTLGYTEEIMELAEYKWNGCEMILTAFDTESSYHVRIENDVISLVSQNYGTTTLFRKGSDALAQYIAENGEDPALIVGAWYNGEDFSEEWSITEDCIIIDGERFDYTVSPQIEYIELTFDDNKYTAYFNEYDGSLMLAGAGDIITLYSEDSEAYREYQLEQKVMEQCSELLARYPDHSGWLESRDYGDIPLLADADYLDEYVPKGYFPVATSEQLASVCYYINTQTADFIVIELTADIDLSGRQWAPMGWGNDNPYNAIFAGNGHIISGLTIDSDDTDIGFIGWGVYGSLTDISFTNADIRGGSSVGIAAGQSIGCGYKNVSVSGSVSGSRAGSLLGYDANSVITDCTVDVNVNGERFEFFSWNEKEKSEIVIEDPVVITMDEDHTVHRPEVEGYHNLGWMVFKDGVQMLHRNAENEYSYRYFLEEAGTYEIYLTAYVKGQYVPISNIITYTIE